MIDLLLQKLEESNSSAAAELVGNELRRKGNAWKIHLSLFPVAQRVLNPPFINPHLPKMYRVCREFLPYLREDEVPGLVQLEISEYARRPKLEKIPGARACLRPFPFRTLNRLSGMATGKKLPPC